MREKEKYYGFFPYSICGNSNLDDKSDNFQEDYDVKETEKPLKALNGRKAPYDVFEDYPEIKDPLSDIHKIERTHSKTVKKGKLIHKYNYNHSRTITVYEKKEKVQKKKRCCFLRCFSKKRKDKRVDDRKIIINNYYS